jgi:hypothetical protein
VVPIAKCQVTDRDSFAGTALGISQARLAQFMFLSFWLADDEGSAAQVFGFKSFLVCQRQSPSKSGI